MTRLNLATMPARPHPDPPHTPPGAATFGLVLILLSLGILFLASVVGYLIIRLVGPNVPDALGSLQVPSILWLSTFIILASSATVHRAYKAVQREHQDTFRRFMVITTVLAYGFLIVQAPGLWDLLQMHDQAYADKVHIYGLIFFLILLHALHVVGGIVPLTLVTIQALRGRYDHEFHGPVQRITLYWHFLDAVWLVMFCVFLLG